MKNVLDLSKDVQELTLEVSKKTFPSDKNQGKIIKQTSVNFTVNNY